jgi:hypothetical protein
MRPFHKERSGWPTSYGFLDASTNALLNCLDCSRDRSPACFRFGGVFFRRAIALIFNSPLFTTLKTSIRCWINRALLVEGRIQLQQKRECGFTQIRRKRVPIRSMCQRVSNSRQIPPTTAANDENDTPVPLKGSQQLL